MMLICLLLKIQVNTQNSALWVYLRDTVTELNVIFSVANNVTYILIQYMHVFI